MREALAPGPNPAARATRRVGAALRPAYDVLFGDPIREGRLRLGGLSPATRQLTVIGLLALAGMLVSVLFNEAWRTGSLVSLGATEGRETFLPAALLPVTLIALFLAWTLALWGGALAAVPVRIAVAILFLLINAPIGKPVAPPLDALGLRWGPTLSNVGYFAAPGALLAFALLELRPAWARRARPFVLGIVTAAAAAFFAGHLWVHVSQVDGGFTSTTPGTLSGAITEIQNLLIPLVYVAGIAVVEFSYDASEAFAIPLWRARAAVAKVVLVGVLGLKLWIQLFRHLHEWGTFIAQRPSLTGRTLFMLLFLAAAVAVIRRLHARAAPPEGAKELLIFGAAVVLALPLLIDLVILAIQEFSLTQFNWIHVSDVFHIPSNGVTQWTDVGYWSAALLLGIYLFVRRGKHPVARDAGIGVILLSLWTLLFFVPEAFGYEPGFEPALFDVGLTVAVAIAVGVLWRRLDGRAATRLAAFVVFSWLVTTEGDFISILGGFVGLSGVIVVVFGVVLSLLADSGFAQGDSRVLPRNSRPLIWVGYLLMSVTLLNWVLSTHSVDLSAGATETGFILLGLPIAAWLLARRPFAPPEEGRAADEVEEMRAVRFSFRRR